VLDGHPSLPTERDTAAPSTVRDLRMQIACVRKPRPMCIVVKRPPISATAEHFLVTALPEMYC